MGIFYNTPSLTHNRYIYPATPTKVKKYAVSSWMVLVFSDDSELVFYHYWHYHFNSTNKPGYQVS